MVGYTALEQAVIDKLLVHFPSELSPTRCLSGDLDAVLEAVFAEDATYGCIVEFAGGRERTREPFKTPVWVWSVFGIFIVRYQAGHESVEQNMRAVVDRLSTLFSDDHTLGRLTPLAKFAEIDAAEPVNINEYPFYWLPFVIEVIDR